MLESARASMGMSKAELARRGRLPPETVRRLLTSNEANPHFSMVADLLKPAGLGLFVGKLDVPAENAPAGPDRVQAWLAHLGAPLYGSTTVDAADVPRPERVLAEALPLARREAAVARALPWPFIARASVSTSTSSGAWLENGGKGERSDSSSISAPSFRETGLSRARHDRSRQRHAVGNARRNSSSCEARRSGGSPN